MAKESRTAAWRWLIGLWLAGCCWTLVGCDLEMAQLEGQHTSASGVRQSTDPQPGTGVTGRTGFTDGTGVTDRTAGSTVAVVGQMTAHFFDVGQGDCTLLQGPDFTILIDAGRHDRRDVVPYLQAAGVREIDLLIGTHPHADHIGQFPDVLEAFHVHDVWMCGEKANSRIFSRTLDAILESGAGYHEPRAGERYRLGSSQIEVLHPERLMNDLNESSICLRFSFGQISLVFTGDAEQRAEREMLQRGLPLTAQILRLGHHGSRTSSSPDFLRAVSPEITIYSAGAGNSYGHPHSEVLDRVARMGIPVLGTDRHGTIRLISDGRTYKVATEHPTSLAERQGHEVLSR